MALEIHRTDFDWQCQHCHKNLNGHASADQSWHEPPDAGNIVICWHCSRVYEVSAKLKLVPASPRVLKDAEVSRALQARRRVKSKSN